MKRDEFLNVVRNRADIGSIFAAEQATRAVFFALKEAMESEDAEEMIIDKLSAELIPLFDNPDKHSFTVPDYLQLKNDDAVAEGQEPEEIAITF